LRHQLESSTNNSLPNIPNRSKTDQNDWWYAKPI
jgi:hypothetical protein